MKKGLKITAIVFFVILLGLAYYYFFFASSTPKTSTTTGNSSLFGNLFPFGQGNNTPSNTTPNPSPTTPDATPIVQTGDYLQKLRLVSNEPVAGATFVENKLGVFIRYMEKATGHIFDVATFSQSTNEISNITIPQIHETFFTDGGQGFVARYVDTDGETIQTIYGKINVGASTSTQITTSATTTQGTSGIFLSPNINSLTVSPSGKSIFYIQKSPSGSTGILSSPNGSAKKQIWDSKIQSILSQFVGENQILITTKPNALVNGFAYMVDTKTGSTKTLLQNKIDLSTFVSPKGDALLSYESVTGGILTYTSLLTATTTTLTPITFPEKCTFDVNDKNILYCAVPTNQLENGALDTWYLGLVSFSDNIWRYDIKNHTAVMIKDLKLNANRDIDAVNLSMNSAGSLLLFTSKADGSLWSLNVTQ